MMVVRHQTIAITLKLIEQPNAVADVVKHKVAAEDIEGLVEAFIKKDMPDAAEIPQCHREWWKMVCSDHRFVAIAAPRGHAKSTAITLAYTLACIIFRERRFVLIVSDTLSQSSLFLGNIKSIIANNDDLKALAGITGFAKEVEDDFIIQFEDGTQSRLMAKGSEQKLRGLNWNGLRPDLIVGDDMENDEIVMNKDRRDKFRRWFTGALMPCKSKDGIIRLVGTILHMDSMLANYMPNERDKDDCIKLPLKVMSRGIKGWFSAKYRAHTSMNDFSKVLWPEYKDAEWLRSEQKSYKIQGLGDVYAQEYLNQPIDDSNSLFRRMDFKAMAPEAWDREVNYYISMDLATSKDNYRDHTAFVIGAVTDNNQLQIRNVIKERLDSSEIVDCIMELNKIYQPMFFVVEKGAITNTLLPMLKVRMYEDNNFMILHTIASTTDKIARSNTIRARMRAGGVYFDKEEDWYADLEEECLMFPRADKDDQVDALSLLGQALDKFVEAPTKEEIQEQAYLDELEGSGLMHTGRSSVTGY
jgi:predicted phage terminase large subunit-like protein